MAYNAATLIEKRPHGDDGTRLVVRFSGNAGETPAQRVFDVTPTTTLLDVRKWAIAQARDLNNRGTVADGLNIGATIDLSAIP